MLQKQYFVFLRFEKLFKKTLVISSGRNYKGRICVYHQGKADKHQIILIDRYRILNLYGSVLRIVNDFFRTAFVGFILYENGLLNFILLSEGVFKNTLIFSGGFKVFNAPLGSTQRVFFIKLFDSINSIEKFPFSGALFARAAGTFGRIVSKNRIFSLLKLNSGWQLKLSSNCLASLGLASNLTHIFLNVRKAGVNRARGIRPVVRGIVKNPCDHPHGGGEGKGSPPVAQVSP